MSDQDPNPQVTQLLIELRDGRRETLGDKDPYRALALAGLGEADRRGGHPERAVPLLEEAAAHLAEVRGPDDGWTRFAVGRLEAARAVDHR